MKAIETILDVNDYGEFSLYFPRQVKPGRYKVLVVVEDEILEEDSVLPPKIDVAYKTEIDRRLEEMEKNPHPGFIMKDVLDELEEEFGRKIQTRTIS